MGQYFKIANLDRLEWFSPRDFDETVKHPESCPQTMRALGLLLRHMWSGDRIAIVGDESYAVLPGFGRECDVYDEMYEPDPDDGDLPPVSPRRWVHITHEVQQLVGPWVKP